MNIRTRPSARLLVIDPLQRVLLFRFSHKGDALDGQSYWATPGGELEEGESWGQAAVRELYEETGIKREQVGKAVGNREFEMQLPSGEIVLAEEKYFIVAVDCAEVSTIGWSDHERRVMTDFRWWRLDELTGSGCRYFPENLGELMGERE